MTPTQVVLQILLDSGRVKHAEINPTGEIVATINHQPVQITVEDF